MSTFFSSSGRGNSNSNNKVAGSVSGGMVLANASDKEADGDNGGAVLGLEEVSAETTSNNNTTVVKDRYGFFVTEDFRKFINLSPEILQARKSKEKERTTKWIKMVKNWEKYTNPHKLPKLKGRCRKGIPDSMRGTAWYRLVRGDNIKASHPYPQPGNMKNLVISQVTIDEIERDIDRTFPRHVLFTEDNGLGQNALRRILRYYASLDPEVGYCQGMGFIAALFLTYMTEEDAFYTFYAVMNRVQEPMRLLFLPKLAEIQKILFVFEQLCHLHLGSLWQHLSSEGLHPTMFFTEWGMTMFIRAFDFDLVTRVWDIFLFEGDYKILYRVSLAIIKSQEEELMDRKFEKIMAFMRELPKRVDGAAILELCWKIPLRRAEIRAAEEE
eukprot:gene11630-13041_t